jgi:AhpD family alkylhydroperoxidase
MNARLNPYRVAPSLMQGLVAFDAQLRGADLSESLVDLVKLRASQINGCAFCIHLHTREARARHESEERLYLLSVWRESSLYSERERAALRWTESLTQVADTHAPDADYEALQQHFSEPEILRLTLLITTINAWNRIAIGFRSQHPRPTSQSAAPVVGRAS